MSIFSNAIKSVQRIVNDVMGTEVTYTYKVGGSTDILAVFENAYVESNGVQSLKPVLKNVRRDDLDHTPVKGDSVTIDSVSYRVIEPQSDGYGTYELILEKN